METKKTNQYPTRDEFILAMRKYKQRKRDIEEELRAQLPEIEKLLTN